MKLNKCITYERNPAINGNEDKSVVEPFFINFWQTNLKKKKKKFIL